MWIGTGEGWLAIRSSCAVSGSPPPRRSVFQRDATVGILRLKDERRMVDQTGIEPVTS
jgi:hypothetical protein